MVIWIVIQGFLISLFSPIVKGQTGNPGQYGLYSSFNPNMAIVVVVLVCAFFFIGIFSICLRRCSEPPSHSSLAALYFRAAAGDHHHPPLGGLQKSVIESFPIMDYSSVKEVKIGKEGLECAVCLSEFENDQSFRFLPQCSHVFHPNCIDMWLASHVTCPVCRANLEETANSLPYNTTPDPQVNEVAIPVNESEDELRQSARVMVGRFSRSHSTGHSLIDVERYTLRLPEELRREVVNRSRLKRTLSSNSDSGVWLTKGGNSSIKVIPAMAGYLEG